MRKENAEFAQRLAVACDQNRDVPPLGRGRNPWIASRVGATAEGVRKWFAGKARPRPEMVERIAKVINVDAAWLALGVSPLRSSDEQKAHVSAAHGAVYLVAGMIEMAGGKVLFPEGERHMGTPDMTAIVANTQLPLYIVTAEHIGVGQYRAMVPANHRGTPVVCVVPGKTLIPRLMVLPNEQIDQFGEKRGGFQEIMMASDDGDFVTEDFVWPRITTFDELARPRTLRVA